jgi:exonuclease III
MLSANIKFLCGYMVLYWTILCYLSRAAAIESICCDSSNICGDYKDFGSIFATKLCKSLKFTNMANYSSEASGHRPDISSGITIQYTQAASNKLQCNFPPGGVKPVLWNRLKELSINNSTKRGVRGGLHQPRPQVIQQCGNIDSYVSNGECAYAIPTVLSKYRRPSPSVASANRDNVITIIPGSVNRSDKQKDIKPATIGVVNARSIMNKAEAIADHIIDNQLDILAITETWIPVSRSNCPTVKNVAPPGYSITHNPRPNRRGGGVGIVYRDTFGIKVMDKFKAKSFESLEVKLTVNSTCLRIAVIYRPPPSQKNGLTKAMFFDEFGDFMANQVISTGKLIILGDFNFCWENQAHPDTVRLKDIFDSHCFQQHVTGVTHVSNHTLDLVLTRTSENIITSAEVSSLFSDHHAVHCTLQIKKPPLPRYKIRYRKIKSMDSEQFREDLRSCPLITSPSTSLSELLVQYDSIKDILDKHCPEKSKTVTLRPVVEWYTPEIAAAKKRRSKCEQLWRKTGLTVHRETYKEERNKVNNLIVNTKQSFYNSKIKDCTDQKSLFRFVNTLLGRNTIPHLPTHDSLEDLLELFSHFFVTKISRIRADLDAAPSNLGTFPSVKHACPDYTLSALNELSETEVTKLIQAAPSKTCQMDPIPTQILKQNVDILAAPITAIINKSLSSGTVPPDMKKAIVTPLIKKPTLDQDNLKNYRPVSNLTFVSKLVERAVDAQVSQHMENSGLHASMQSAYRPKHSVETAMVKVHNDIMREIDQSRGVILVILDNSAAFDTLDHNILLQNLEKDIGITDVALKWFRSYLSDRSQQVLLHHVLSDPVHLKCGVPQGSVLGPKEFVTLTRLVELIAKLYGVSIHLYADDTQLYVSFALNNPQDLADAKERLEKCIAHISAWMHENKLKLNGEKTEVMVICHPRQRHKLGDITIQVGEAEIVPALSARNLGVLYD